MAINEKFQNILDEIRVEEKKLNEYEKRVNITFLGDMMALIKGDETYKLNRCKVLDQRNKVVNISNEFDKKTYYSLNSVLLFLERSISILEDKPYYSVRLHDFSDDKEKGKNTSYKNLLYDLSKSSSSFVIMPEDCIDDLNNNIRSGNLSSISDVDRYLIEKGVKHITFPAFEEILLFNYENEYNEDSFDHVPTNITRDFPYLENIVTDFLAYSYYNNNGHCLDNINDYLAMLAVKCKNEENKKMIKSL